MSSASAPAGPAAPPSGRWPERLLRPFADVRAVEAPQLLLLALNVFLLLAAYYVMKPVREALILAQPGGAEIKSYAIAVQALLFIPAVSLYGALAARMARRRLINVVTLFFIGCLPVFYVLARSGVSVGIAFLLWIGVFSLMVVAQFWAFAADLYTPEAGKRLFALIAFGASSGAVAGAFVCHLLIGAIGVYPLLLVAAGILAVSLGVFNLVERLARRAGGSAVTAAGADRPIGEGNPFAIVFRHRYLTLVALLMMVLNWVNSTGEYMLGSTVAAAGAQEIAAGRLRAEEHGAFIGHFYAGYFQAINVVGMVLQLFVVSRVIAYLGLPVAVCLLPLVALACYGLIAMAPFLAVLRWGRTTERAIDYSLQNTVSQILYLPTARADKYKAKQAIDTFFVRAGDVLSAGTVLVGSVMLALGLAGFALINAVLVLVWLALAVAVGREFARRVPAPGAAADGPEGQPMSHQTPSRQYGALGALAIVLLCPALAAAGDPAGSGARSDRVDLYRAYIAQMKGDPRGPFSAVKWYCKDGSVLPPRPNACSGRGGGVQHGEWSDRTRELRARGYKVATFLAGLDAAAAVAAPDFTDTYTQLLIEKFLVAADDGWIFRQAQFYRGAFQTEDERDGARRLLVAMAARPDWIGHRYPALRSGARLLPHGEDTASAQKVRQAATALSDRDPGFAGLRAKIHNAPDAGDAVRVREYGSTPGGRALGARYEALAAEIDRLYRPRPLDDRLGEDARALAAAPNLQARLAAAAREYTSDAGADGRYAMTARLLADLRTALPGIASAAARLRVIDLSLAVEAETFRAGAELGSAPDGASRAAQVARLRAGVDAAYGTGLINARARAALERGAGALAVDRVALADYRRELRYLGLLPGWSAQELRQHFGEAMAKLVEIEPMADLFIQDQLRGSPVLFYAQVLDRLSRDANQLAGVRHRLLGREVGAGFNALNPGLARGVMHAAPDMRRVADFARDGIYVLPETVAALPPVAGILTAGAGNPLSHVQLLARNLGIPNVAVDGSLVAALRAADGQRIVLAVSAAGLVEIAEDGPGWDAMFAGDRSSGADVVFTPDLAKLDLSVRDFVSLDRLRARDSGRIVGPKAAKLGELRASFPDRVAPGVAIPFGVYRETVLDRPYRNSGRTVFEWMADRFRVLEAMAPGSREASAFAEALRAEIYAIVRNTDLGPESRQRLKAAMARDFGPDFKGGVFVRSDTNVEDLPGFTGAGLNLTVPNVVGFDRVVKAIAEVWASPYTERAFAWRQSHMKGPEHVYPAVLLLPTVPADASGVLVTQDIDTGDRSILSVAVNEGVGGAVEGQATESLRIDTRTGDVRLMAVATAPRRMVPRAAGGMASEPVSGRDTVLAPEQIRELIAVAAQIGLRVPQVGEDGAPAAADIEFAFAGGRLWLLQIRPLNESRQAQGHRYLIAMDRALAQNLGRAVDMRAAPPK